MLSTYAAAAWVNDRLFQKTASDVKSQLPSIEITQRIQDVPDPQGAKTICHVFGIPRASSAVASKLSMPVQSVCKDWPGMHVHVGGWSQIDTMRFGCFQHLLGGY